MRWQCDGKRKTGVRDTQPGIPALPTIRVNLGEDTSYVITLSSWLQMAVMKSITQGDSELSIRAFYTAHSTKQLLDKLHLLKS